MIVYMYDNTFEGLLTCIYEAYYSNIKPEAIYSKLMYEYNLIDNVIEIETNEKKYLKVYESIENKISKESFKKYIILIYLN